MTGQFVFSGRGLLGSVHTIYGPDGCIILPSCNPNCHSFCHFLLIRSLRCILEWSTGISTKEAERRGHWFRGRRWAARRCKASEVPCFHTGVSSELVRYILLVGGAWAEVVIVHDVSPYMMWVMPGQKSRPSLPASYGCSSAGIQRQSVWERQPSQQNCLSFQFSWK